MRAPARRIVPLVALLVAPFFAPAANLFAQGSRSTPDSLEAGRGEWLAAVTLGVPGVEREPIPQLLTIGGQWTQLRVGRVGADFAIGTMPRILAEGALVLGARGGIALPLALSPNVLVLPSGGVSVLGGAGAGGVGGVGGYNAGVAAVVLGANGGGLRTGVTWHRFEDAGAAIWLWEIGFVRGPRSR